MLVEDNLGQYALSYRYKVYYTNKYKLSESQAHLFITFIGLLNKDRVHIKEYNGFIQINKRLKSFYYITYYLPNGKTYLPYEYKSHLHDFDVKFGYKVHKATLQSLVKKGIFKESIIDYQGVPTKIYDLAIDLVTFK